MSGALHASDSDGRYGRVLPHLAAALLLALVVAVAYVPPLLSGRVYYSQDTTDLNYVMLRSHVTDLKNNGFTAWCEQAASGFFRASDPTYALYSPRLLLYLAVPGYDAQLATILAYALWAGLGGYVLGFSLLRNRSAGLFIGIAWPLCGVVASTISNIPYMTSAAWLPWCLAAWTGLRRPSARSAATGFCLAMVAVEGDLFGMGIFAAVLGLYSALAPASGSRRKEALPWLAAVVLSAGLTAVIWMPALSSLSGSRRAAGLAAWESLSFSMHPARLLNLFAPRFFGQPHENSFWAEGITSSIMGTGLWFQTVYLGLLTPLLWIAALVKKGPGRRSAAVFALMAAVFTVLAFGKHAPVMPWLMDTVPYLHSSRYPAKLFTYASLFILCPAAAGLIRTRDIARDAGPGLLVIAPALLYLLPLTIALSLAADSIEQIKQSSGVPGLSFIRIYQDLIRLVIFAALLPFIAFIAGRRAWARRLLPGVLLFFMAADMLTALPVFYMNPRYDLFRPSHVAGRIKGHGPGRVTVADDMYDHLRAGPRGSLLYNWGVLEGVDYALGKAAALPSMLYDLNKKEALLNHGAAVLRMTATRYLVALARPRSEWVTKLLERGLIKELERFPDMNLVLYESTGEGDRVFVTRRVRTADSAEHAFNLALGLDVLDSHTVFISTDFAIRNGKPVKPRALPGAGRPPEEPADRVISIERPHGDRLTIELEISSAGWLVVREYPGKGWRAFIDGEEALIYIADGIGRAVFLDRGRHRVEFKFEPRSLKAGAVVSAAFAVVALCVAVISYSGRRGGRSR